MLFSSSFSFSYSLSSSYSLLTLSAPVALYIARSLAQISVEAARLQRYQLQLLAPRTGPTTAELPPSIPPFLCSNWKRIDNPRPLLCSPNSDLTSDGGNQQVCVSIPSQPLLLVFSFETLTPLPPTLNSITPPRSDLLGYIHSQPACCTTHAISYVLLSHRQF